jgi:autotransporter-associated beta strand protein
MKRDHQAQATTSAGRHLPGRLPVARRWGRHSAGAIVAFVLVSMAGGNGDVLAATKTWTGGDSNDSNWTSNGNWTGILAPGANDDLVFVDGSRRTNVNNFPINTNFDSLSFSGTNFSITGNAIFLGSGGSGGITANITSSTTWNFAPNILLGRDQTFSSTAATQFPYTLKGVVNLQSHVLTLSGTGAHVFDGTITVGGKLIKNGTGTATLNALNSSSVAVTLNAGTLNVGSSGSIGATTMNGGTLRVDGAAGAIALNGGNLTGSGPVGNITALAGGVAKTIAPAGVVGTATGVLVAGAATLTASTTLAIDLDGTASGQFDRLDCTTINLNGANLTVTPGFAATIGSTSTIVTGVGAGSVTGQFAQGNSITTANGTVFSIAYNSSGVVLTRQPSTDTWSGGGADNNWTTGANWVGKVAPAAGDNLVFPAAAARPANTNNYPGGTHFGSITLNGTGYVIGGNPITLSGGISENVATYNSGADVRPQLNLGVTLGAAQAFAANLNGFVLGGSLNLNGFVLTLTGAASENLLRPSPKLAGVISGAGSISKTGVGEFTLSANNTYTGFTTINAGVLGIQHGNALGATGAGNSTTVASGATLRFNGDAISSAESIVLAGTGTADYAALQVSGCASGCTISAPLTLTANSDLNITPPVSAATLTISAAIGESGGVRTLTKSGGGTLILSGANTYSGATTISSGPVLVNGTIGAVALAGGTLGGSGTVGAISGNGTVAPGASAGLLTSGSVTFGGADTFSVEIGGLTAGTQHDKLNANGTVDLGGATLQGSLLNAFVPVAGNSFTIIQSSGAISGQFAQGATVVFGGVTFDVTYNSNSVALTVAGGALPDLTVTKSHSGNFAQGQVGAQYTATVTNSGAGNMIAASVSLVDSPPAGLSITAMSGTGWTCAVLPTCTRGDALVAFASYPPVTITATVAANATSPQVNSIAVTTAAAESNSANNSDDDTTTINLPDLKVIKTHTGNFFQGQTGATYSVAVNNTASGAKPDGSLVTLVDTAPTGMTVTAMSGSGWNCSVLPNCTRTDVLAASSGYPAITVTVNVSRDATSPLINNAAVSTAATENNTGNNNGADPTVIDVATDFVVRSTLDTDGTTCETDCTLRQALNAANLRSGADNIVFAIASGAPPFTISPTGPLPTITDTVAIQGYTQTGATVNTLADGEDAVILVQLDGSDAGINVSALGVCANSVSVRGLSITGYAGRAIDVGGTTTQGVCGGALTGITLAGNFIGLLPDGSPGGNEGGGLSVFGASNLVIGGAAPADRNVISANGDSGVFLRNPGTGRRLDNNFIGTDLDGQLDLGNVVAGVRIAVGANNVLVGLLAPNRVSYNATGIVVDSGAGTGNQFFANDIEANAGLGIDIGANGVTANDADDSDTGANALQNFPDLTAITIAADSITVNGTLDVPDDTSNADYTIAIYQSASCDASGFGEGSLYLGSKEVVFNGNGGAAPEPFSAKLFVVPAGGGVFSATATDPAGNTSEFSACLPVDLLFRDGFE